VILTSECLAIGEGAITIYFYVLGFDTAGTSGARTHDFLDAKREPYPLGNGNRFEVVNETKKK
jgi:hypothetical protein